MRNPSGVQKQDSPAYFVVQFFRMTGLAGTGPRIRLAMWRIASGALKEEKRRIRVKGVLFRRVWKAGMFAAVPARYELFRATGL